MIIVKLRTILVAGLATVSLVALAGCSGASGSNTADKLQFVLSGDAAQGGGYQAMADKYEKETGIKIEIVDVPYDDLRTKLRNGAQAGDLPALARADSLDPLWSKQLIDLSGVADAAGIVPELLVPDPNDDNKVKALPSDLTAVGMYLNTSLWDAAGVAYPGPNDVWTWDQYVTAIKQVQAKSGAKYGMVMDPSAHRLSAFMFEFGSKGVEEQPDGSFSMNAQSATALEYFKSLNDDSFMPKSVWLSNADPSALFKSGEVAAYFSGVWQVTDFTQNITAFKWTSVRTPAQPVQATNLGTNWIVAFNGTGVEKEASDFIAWLYKPENYAELAAISGFLPSVKGLKVDYPANAEAFQVYNDEIAASDPIAASQAAGDIAWGYDGRFLESGPLKDETIKYLAGEQDLKTTIANIESQTEQQLKD